MTKESMSDADFGTLLARIQQETDSPYRKLHILHSSRGYFDAEQASLVLHALSRSDDKIRAIRMMEPRLSWMTCKDARLILQAIPIHQDRLCGLDSVKRSLTDAQTAVGEEYILSTFPYEGDKRKALTLLKTVHSNVADLTPAGGHQMYAPLGGVYSQSRPLNLHVYGDLYTQRMEKLGQGKIEIPVTAKQGVVPSIYTGHPSYAYPVDKTYDENHHYPGTVGFPARVEGPSVYPGGAPPLGSHSGVPASTGFPKLDLAGFVY